MCVPAQVGGFSHLRTFDVRKSSIHVLTPPKLGALREMARDNITIVNSVCNGPWGKDSYSPCTCVSIWLFFMCVMGVQTYNINGVWNGYIYHGNIDAKWFFSQFLAQRWYCIFSGSPQSSKVYTYFLSWMFGFRGGWVSTMFRFVNPYELLDAPLDKNPLIQYL